MIGKRLGHYEIVEKLGEGGMGVVYKARDLRLNRLAAIKVLHPDKVADENRKRRFVQEAQAASALNHPNIITIYDIASEGGADFLVMEYLPGRTLDHVIPRVGLRLDELLRYSISIADALTKAHSVGIIHRDLKPSNIIVSDDGRVKLLDFGLAKLTEPSDSSPEGPTLSRQPHTEDGAVVGTVSYMSPEQAEGKKVDARSDIFAFGAVLYEMTTGRKAFSGESRMSALTAILRDEPKRAGEIVEGVPRDLEKIITRCLRKDLERRYQHIDDVKLALVELKEESDSGKARPAPPVAPKGRWVLPTSTAVLVTAALAAAVWFFGSRTPAPPLRVVPLTSFPGVEGEAALSPDGKQVAFSWNGEKQDNTDIYVKLVDAGTPIRLTSDAGTDSTPAWSRPDGRFIAFRRSSGEQDAWFLIPALGGRERKLADIPRLPVEGATAAPLTLDWSPDGKYVILVDTAVAPATLALLAVGTEEKHKLAAPPEKSVGDFFPAFSPDGRSLAFVRVLGSGVMDLYRAALSASYAVTGESQRLTSDNTLMTGIAWTADSREIVFSSFRDGAAALWRISASGAGAPRRVAGVSQDAFWPSISRQGQRLTYTNWFIDLDIWRVALAGAAGPSSPPIPLISSSLIEFQGEYSPDGSKIVFSSNRSGNFEIWVSSADGSNAEPLTSFGGPGCFAPRWSPNGRQIAFASRPGGNIDVYLVDAQGGLPRKLTSDPTEDSSARWSRDGRWVYFVSYRTGGPQVWKTPADGSGKPMQVTHAGGRLNQESPDGKFLFYTKVDRTGLWRMPIEGGPESLLIESIPDTGWVAAERGIYFLRFGTGIQLFSYTDNHVTDVAPIPDLTPFFSAGHISVSPDGRWAIYTGRVQSVSDIKLVENFQ